MIERDTQSLVREGRERGDHPLAPRLFNSRPRYRGLRQNGIFYIPALEYDTDSQTHGNRNREFSFRISGIAQKTGNRRV